jgi:hypothetical protein
MAANFGMLSPGLALIVGGLRKAPAPQQQELGGDWLRNLDVMSHGIGCMVCGVFDTLVDGLDREQIIQVQPSNVSNMLEDIPPWLERLVVSSFEVCREAYLEYGDLTDAVEAKKFDPSGIVVAAGVMPLLKRKQPAVKSSGIHPLLRPTAASKGSAGITHL